ncbi:MAG: ABC transporter ATP-binding protein [bacterium]
MSCDTEVAIEVNDLGKAFAVYTDPTDRLKRGILHRLFPSKRQSENLFWAIRSISFTVKKGESVGIVGRNGAGKSTLLQLICGTLQASEGTCTTRGSIAALLELGSGFNPDFSGRENVFLYGQVLGIPQKRMQEQIDQILAFADIGEFIDRPVKTYSSGMIVRLAFAVSVSREPDILIVDEALAVGDEAFKRKCFSRIDELRAQGTTLLFVSHSANLVAELCDRVVVVDQGGLIFSGEPKVGLSWYSKLLFASTSEREEVRRRIQNLSEASLAEPDDPINPSTENNTQNPVETVTAFYAPSMVSESRLAYSPSGAEILNEHIETLDGQRVNVLIPGERYVYTYDVLFLASVTGVGFGMMIRSITGTDIGGGVFPSWQKYLSEIGQGVTYKVRFEFDCLLNPGVYFFNAGVQGSKTGDSDPGYLHRIIDAVIFRVLPAEQQIATGLVNLRILPTAISIEGK